MVDLLPIHQVASLEAGKLPPCSFPGPQHPCSAGLGVTWLTSAAQSWVNSFGGYQLASGRGGAGTVGSVGHLQIEHQSWGPSRA
jgi:hypothetical protein